MERKLKTVEYWEDWRVDDKSRVPANRMFYLPRKLDTSSATMQDIFFTKKIIEGEALYTHATHTIHSMPETVAHRILRSSKKANQLLKVSSAVFSVIRNLKRTTLYMYLYIQELILCVCSCRGYCQPVKRNNWTIQSWLCCPSILIIHGNLSCDIASRQRSPPSFAITIPRLAQSFVIPLPRERLYKYRIR